MARTLSPKVTYKYHHLGIPTRKKKQGMIGIRHLQMYATDHESNPFGIQWMKFEKDCSVSKLVRAVPHVAFEVNNLKAALKGAKIIARPSSPSPGVIVAMIEVSGAPVELLEFTDRRANRAHIAQEFKKSGGSLR